MSVVDVFGQRDQAIEVDCDQFGVRIGAVGEGDAIAWHESRILRCGNDLARRLVTRDPRRITGQGVVALATIDVGEIQADRTGADQRLLRRRYRIGKFAQLHDLGTAEAIEYERANVSPSARRVRDRS